MAWKDAKERWRMGRIQPEEPWSDVRDWLLEDPVWTHRYDDFGCPVHDSDRGSHEFVIRIPGLTQVVPKTQNDTFSVSRKGRHCKRWQVQVLVQIYEQLADLED